jgi:hypothetical protein
METELLTAHLLTTLVAVWEELRGRGAGVAELTSALASSHLLD